jgi:hypothetical protein
MWTQRLAACGLACCAFAAAAEPRIPGMDEKLEASLARGDYLFVWDLDRDTVGRGDPYRTLRTYYDGLIYAVTEARRLVEPGTPAQLHLDPMRPVSGWDEAYAGTLTSHETHLGGNPLVLHAEITRRDCGRSRVQVFFALSQSPRDAASWPDLRKARERISCDKSKN